MRELSVLFLCCFCVHEIVCEISSVILCATGGGRSAFQEHFDACRGEEVATFQNLGGDAVLVAPCPPAESAAAGGIGDAATEYGHLARFVRAAPLRTAHALLRAGAAATLRRVESGDRPVWLSTSGAGVPWLHVRIDSSPKYYQHLPYRATP